MMEAVGLNSVHLRRLVEFVKDTLKVDASDEETLTDALTKIADEREIDHETEETLTTKIMLAAASLVQKFDYSLGEAAKILKFLLIGVFKED